MGAADKDDVNELAAGVAKPMSQMDAFALLCKSTGKWGLYISGAHDCDMGEIVKAAPFLDPERDAAVILNGMAILLFDTEGEQRAHYDRVVGDEGPTKLNPYDGPARWFALTCGPDGELMTENT